MNLLIKHADIVCDDTILSDYDILCRDGRIETIGKDITSSGDSQVIDAAGNFLVPGFVDLHIHGMQNYLVDDGAEELQAICQLLPQYGVTGFLPTLCPKPKGEDAAYVRTLAGATFSGASVLGFHLEGPYLKLTGAIPAENLRNADRQRAEGLIEAAKPYPAIFSVSPELENISDLISLMSQNKSVPVFMTHTMANVKETLSAIEAGVCHATHFYDVFPTPPVTEPGVRPSGAVEAILADSRVTVDFILDGEHVDPYVIKMAIACKGLDHVCLITDANKGAGLPPGRYHTIGYEVEFRYPGAPARGTENAPYPGSLAGSGLTMDQGLRNSVNRLDVDLVQAVRMVSSNPTNVLKLKTKGIIKEGYDADLVLLDKTLNVLSTWIGGKNYFTRK